MKITHNSTEYRFVGYRIPRAGEKYVSDEGDTITSTWGVLNHARLIVEPVPVRHVFGGRTVEETGPEQVGLEPGEWGIEVSTGNLMCANHLKFIPVRLVSDE